MNVTVKNSDFARELNLLEKVCGKKPTISVLANVLIQAAGGGVQMSATDLEIGLVGFCPGDVKEAGAVTLPAKKLVDLVRTQSADNITLQDDTRNAVKFTSGGFASRLQGLPAVDFPGIPSMEGHPSITLPRAGLKDALSQIRFAISDKEQKYFMKGAYLAFPADGLILVATDAARLAITTLPRQGPERDAILVPTSCVDELAMLLAEPGNDDVTLAQSERHLFFDLDGRTLISRQVDGKFPAYERIIPKDNTNQAKVDRLGLLAILRRLVLIDEIVELSFKAYTLDCSAASQDVGDGVERLVIEYEGPDIVFRFKGQFLIDFLSAATGDTITVAMRDAAAPALFIDDAYRNVVMGMRV